MSNVNIFSILSIILNFSLVLIILVRSPNEQSLQENLDPFKLFESSSRAEKSIDKLIQILTILYFVLALVYNIQRYF
uniref:Probable protein-export membrane protein SecG n=2 Tax=Alaria TaxID=2888 RepID=A0A8E8PDT8_9PHAE|nr:SecG [Alaria crispa]YP_010206623.1 SecG [Alaria marginata]YP_010206764.1 SecG [Alaria esculenta]YP_010206905.1 SecG [Alaria crassifolia]YP_010207046.1 SecG [Alaria praelonga]UAX21925.1 SecG [Alaria sp. PI001]UAX22066.1 SecG [Alaria sp. PI20]UAX22489.1 SecG [Alaria sp. TTB000023]UAX22630.1 SecG [Alaria sp. TTB000026]UAX22771.1 SecG [Alaria sp. TTB000053]